MMTLCTQLYSSRERGYAMRSRATSKGGKQYEFQREFKKEDHSGRYHNSGRSTDDNIHAADDIRFRRRRRQHKDGTVSVL